MAMKDVRPLGDRVIVKRDEADQTTQGGIVLPDSAKKENSRGVVMACGDGAPLENGTVRPMQVKVGDKVLFGNYAGSDVRIDGEDYLVMKESDLVAIVSF